MSLIKIFCQPALAVLLCNSMTLEAQQLATQAIKTESGVDFTPQLEAELRHDDNIGHSADAEQASWISLLTPKLNVALLSGANRYSADITLISGSYISSPDDNFLDWQLDTDALLDVSSRHRFLFNAGYGAKHEVRGTGITEGQGNDLTTPAEFNRLNLQAEYQYGTRSSRTQLHLQAAHFDKQYRNYDELTLYRNFQSTKLGTELFYLSGANIRLISEINRLHTRYDQIDLNGSRDNDTMNYRLGVHWQPSELTSAELRLGYQHRQFDNADRQDFSGLAWQMTVQWAPLSYSRFNLHTGRQSKEPDTQGDFVEETYYSLFWHHQWRPLFSSSMGVKHTTDDYTGFSRRDRLTSYQLSGKYSVLPQLLVSAGAISHRNNSTLDNLQFDKNEVFLNLQLAL